MPSGAAPPGDLTRVRRHLLDGLGARYRQTVILSATQDPAMRAALRGLENHQGSALLLPRARGVLDRVGGGCRQHFRRVPGEPAPAAEADARLEHFRREVLPAIRERAGVLVFVPSYLDYVRVRELCAREGASFAGVCEYARPPEVARARGRFFAGERRVMLYTERAHFYNRFRLRGVRELVFYAPPQSAHFYLEMVNMMTMADDAGGGPAEVLVLFTPLDRYRLDRLVGAARAARMAGGQEGSFVFV